VAAEVAGSLARQRRDALAALELLGPAAEAARAYVSLRPDATSRECRPDHVTASAVVLSPDAGWVMLHLHAKVGRWLQFGGHLEPDDAGLAEAALRETREESGCAQAQLWSARPMGIDVHDAPCGARHHLDVQYAAVVPADAQPRRSAESDAVEWFAVGALPASCDASVRRLVAQAVSVVRPTPSS
jgi:8-oxo-dGTP pyrophosphatase MutT (NUDIX family)